MNRVRKQRRTETISYVVIWALIVGIMTLDMMQVRATLNRPLFDWDMPVRLASNLIPFLILFIVSNSFLIPKLLLRNRITAYLLCTTVCLLLLWGYQYMEFVSHDFMSRPEPHPGLNIGPQHVHRRPLLPLPLFLDFTYGLLVIGGNLAVALLFQRFDDKLERESLQKANAENALAYLKAQINPHFYMNMLNNIHAMIEIDPEKAQEMVIDMSCLMRYMLYDSQKPFTPLVNEVEFIDNYLRLMRLRYPESKVEISASFPPADTLRGINIPPLLMLGFVENAFKHGISYRAHSFVDIKLEISDGKLMFRIVNSNHASEKENTEKSGIGLVNANRRLELIFGASACLKINPQPDTYTVTLSIPVNETSHSDN